MKIQSKPLVALALVTLAGAASAEDSVKMYAGQCQVLLGRHSETHRRQITAAV